MVRIPARLGPVSMISAGEYIVNRIDEGSGAGARSTVQKGVTHGDDSAGSPFFRGTLRYV